jgi:hypothetical protein
MFRVQQLLPEAPKQERILWGIFSKHFEISLVTLTKTQRRLGHGSDGTLKGENVSTSMNRLID